MIPLIIAIAIAPVGAALLAAKHWDEIMIALRGKSVAVLGARGVGKTHLITFFESGDVPQRPGQTVAPRKTQSREFRLKELEIRVKESRDVSGDDSAYGDWKDLVASADVVLYLLRADRLFAADAAIEERVRKDLRHIGEWLESRASRPRFFIVGTHCDKDHDFQGLRQNHAGQYQDKFRQLPVVKDLVAQAGGTQVTAVVLGSMESKECTETLAYEIFKQVSN